MASNSNRLTAGANRQGGARLRRSVAKTVNDLRWLRSDISGGLPSASAMRVDLPLERLGTAAASSRVPGGRLSGVCSWPIRGLSEASRRTRIAEPLGISATVQSSGKVSAERREGKRQIPLVRIIAPRTLGCSANSPVAARRLARIRPSCRSRGSDRTPEHALRSAGRSVRWRPGSLQPKSYVRLGSIGSGIQRQDARSALHAREAFCVLIG
jgi:hypothetical protein